MTVFEKDPKPDLREQLGVAMRADDLKLDERSQRAVDRIAALGAVQSDAAPSGARRLAATLWRLAYDRDVSQRRPAAIQFAFWMRRRPEYHRWKVRDGNALVLRFALMAVIEWERRAPGIAAERAQALGLPIETYYRHWPHRFDWAKAQLDYLESCLTQPLQQKLSARIVRASNSKTSDPVNKKKNISVASGQLDGRPCSSTENVKPE